MLTEQQRNFLKDKLLRKQNELIQRMRRKFSTESSYLETLGELSSYDNHPADTATELHEREKDAAFEKRLENELSEINDALHAIEEGTYGLCRICNEPISYERLKALPEADTCFEHAKEMDAYRDGTVTKEQLKEYKLKEDIDVATDENEAWLFVKRDGTSDVRSDLD